MAGYGSKTQLIDTIEKLVIRHAQVATETNRAMIAYLSLYWPKYLPPVKHLSVPVSV